MRKSSPKIHISWEYSPTPDAQARLKAAFDLLFHKACDASEPQNLTENQDGYTMSHDDELSSFI